MLCLPGVEAAGDGSGSSAQGPGRRVTLQQDCSAATTGVSPQLGREGLGAGSPVCYPGAQSTTGTVLALPSVLRLHSAYSLPLP